MSEEKVYTFNEYVLGYDSGRDNDRSCLTISKILNDNMYVMSTLYDGSAEVISTILDSLQQKVEQLEKELNQEKEEFAGLHKVLNNKEEEFEKENYNNVVEISRLKRKVEQLENIRKEAIEYVLKNKLYRFKYDDEELFEITTDKKAKDDLLNILNKGSDKE